ncbi:MAG: PilZ domain-containing protein [Deltaproteobacteria bacterium]|nr:PilZ domain-containing protein [Deltaproteobacteria bacterium]
MEEEDTRPAADRRKYLRAPLIVLKVKLEGGGRSFFGYAKNISRSGMFIASVNPRDPGSCFQVEIPLPDPLRRKVVCRCEVVWNRSFSERGPYEPGMGLKFLDMPQDVAAAIDEWIRASSEEA